MLCGTQTDILFILFQYLTLTAKGGLDKPRRFIFGGVSQETRMPPFFFNVVSFMDMMAEI